MTKKDQKIITDARREGIPIFVFTAKDSLAMEALHSYKAECDYQECNPEHIIGIQERIDEFEAWRRENSEKVKLPD